MSSETTVHCLAIALACLGLALCMGFLNQFVRLLTSDAQTKVESEELESIECDADLKDLVNIDSTLGNLEASWMK